MKQNKCFKLDILSSKNRDYDIFVKLTVFLDISKMLVSKFFHWSSWKYLNFWRSKWYRGVLKLSTLYPPSHNCINFFGRQMSLVTNIFPHSLFSFPVQKVQFFALKKFSLNLLHSVLKFFYQAYPILRFYIICCPLSLHSRFPQRRQNIYRLRWEDQEREDNK